LAALAEALLVEAEEGAALLDDPELDAHVEQPAVLGDALVVEDVELGDLERRRDLVLDDLHFDARADDLRALLDAVDPADVEANRGVELERPAARRRLGVAE